MSFWTEERTQTAIEHWREGQPASLIALDLRTTRSAVLGKLRRLGEVGKLRGSWRTCWHADVREQYAEGQSLSLIAQCWGISTATVQSIVGKDQITTRKLQMRGNLKEAILDAWGSGDVSSRISARYGTTLSHVTVTVCRARHRGDPRAERRR